MAQTESEQFATPEEAAAFLRCSPITVKRLAREGKLPVFGSRVRGRGERDKLFRRAAEGGKP